MKSSRRHNRTRNKYRRTKRHLTVDPNCWGKNEPLEQLWRDLSSFLSIVIVYKGNKPYKIVELRSNDETTIPHSNVDNNNNNNKLRTIALDPQVVAILSANPKTTNVYETLLYPKAKDMTVDYVITNYNKFFKPIRGHPIKKLMSPY